MRNKGKALLFDTPFQENILQISICLSLGNNSTTLHNACLIGAASPHTRVHVI